LGLAYLPSGCKLFFTYLYLTLVYVKGTRRLFVTCLGNNGQVLIFLCSSYGYHRVRVQLRWSLPNRPTPPALSTTIATLTSIAAPALETSDVVAPHHIRHKRSSLNRERQFPFPYYSSLSPAPPGFRLCGRPVVHTPVGPGPKKEFEQESNRIFASRVPGRSFEHR